MLFISWSKPVQPSTCNSFCQHWQKTNGPEQQQERQSEEIRSMRSLLSRRVTVWTYSKHKACVAGKKNQAWSQNQTKGRYDASFHRSSNTQIKTLCILQSSSITCHYYCVRQKASSPQCVPQIAHQTSLSVVESCILMTTQKEAIAFSIFPHMPLLQNTKSLIINPCT